MVRTLYPIVSTFVQLHHTVFDKRQLRLLLDTHPDFISLNNITDAIDHLQLPNRALEINIDQLTSLPLPLLSMLHLNNRAEFVVLTNIEKESVAIINEQQEQVTISQTAFRAAWQSVVVLVEVSEDRKKRSFRPLQYISSPPVLLVTAMLLAAVTTVNLPVFFYNLLSLTGLCISMAIFLTAHGRSTVLNRFCSGSGRISCQSVFESKGAHLFGRLPLADTSLLYFATLFMTSLFVQNAFASLAWIVSAAALLIVPYSIYYQAKVVKKWCPLCLGIVTILILQAVFTWTSGFVFVYPVMKAVLSMAVTATALTGLGALAKQQFQTVQNAQRFEEEALAFKRNYELFMAAYDKQPLLPVTGFQSPVAYGDPQAPVQLIVVSNPLCRPCAETHHIITQLIKLLPGQLCIQYVFYCNPADDQDQRTRITRRLTALCSQLPPAQQQQVLDHWYEQHTIQPAYANALTTHLNDTDRTNKTISLFYQFRTRLQIHVSPTLILNGRRLPAGYYPDCLPWVLPYCADRLPVVTAVNTNFFLQEKQLQW